jgi:hypothetical protein
MSPRAFAATCATFASLAAGARAPAAPPEQVLIRGRAACLDDAGERRAVGAKCDDHPSGGWAIESEGGVLHRLSPGDSRVAMLGDVRVRSHELQIVAWHYDDGHLAIVHLYTVIDGKLHDPYYYCPICAIRAHAPGPCWCCGRPLELRDPPLEGGSAPAPP